MGANVATTQHDKLVWAAYILGHHPGWLSRWQTSVWGVRNEAAEGRIQVDAEPPTEVDELADAVLLIAQRMLPDPACAALLSSGAAWLTHAIMDMLREVRHPWSEDGEADWDEPLPDGVQHAATVCKAAIRAFARDSHLERWRELGDWLCDLQASVTCLQDEDARDLCTRLRVLNWSSEYPFVQRLCGAIEFHDYAHKVGDADELIDPTFARITVGRVDAVIRRHLSDGAQPEPWIAIGPEYVRYLGKVWHPRDFPPAELRILWVLCERPRQPVSCKALVRLANLNCQPEDVKPHIARLKKRLLSGLLVSQTNGLDIPEGAEQWFIKGHAGAYELQLDMSRVLVVPPRPSFLPGGEGLGATLPP
jgi:DNA-binding response OmpR family regulator